MLGYIINPLMQPTDLCLESGLGRDALGRCPDVFNVEALVTILAAAALLGAVGTFIGWLVAQGKGGATPGPTG